MKYFEYFKNTNLNVISKLFCKNQISEQKVFLNKKNIWRFFSNTKILINQFSISTIEMKYLMRKLSQYNIFKKRRTLSLKQNRLNYC